MFISNIISETIIIDALTYLFVSRPIIKTDLELVTNSVTLLKINLHGEILILIVGYTHI